MKSNSIMAVIAMVWVVLCMVGNSIADTPLYSNTDQSAFVTIFQEAENYTTIYGPMATFTDGMASNNSALEGNEPPYKGWAKYNINVPQAGVYVMWGRVKGNLNGWSNSFFVSMDDGYMNIWDFNKDDIWKWERLSDRGTGSFGHPQTNPVKFNLTAGPHVLMIANREYYSKIDCFILTNNLGTIAKPVPPRGIHLQTPGWGEIITPGQPYEIKWTSFNITGQVNIDLSKDQGNTFTVNVATATANDGSFIWNVPAYLKLGKAVLRIRETVGPAQDVTWGYFAIINPHDPKVGIFMVRPSGGETLVPGQFFSIKWLSFAFNGYVNLFYSTNNGATWKPVGGWYEVASANYKWTVPNEPSTHCLIKVVDAFDGAPFAMSNTFTILPPGPVLSNGSEENSAQSSSAWTEGLTPDSYKLGPNYPNPFNPVTRIPFSLPETGYVKLTIYDVMGQEIETLVDGVMEAGFYDKSWNAADKSTGVYIAKLTTQHQVFMQKLLLVK
jgi:hypothetical protein